jgi:hypothetical protein
MAAPSVAVSESLTLSSNTEQHYTANHYYSTIIVDNSGENAGTGGPLEVYVCTDGGTATVQGAHCQQVPYGQTRVFSNLQALTDENAAPNDSNTSLLFSDISFVTGWNVQTAYSGTNRTYCSLIIGGSAASQDVTITFQ